MPRGLTGKMTSMIRASRARQFLIAGRAKPCHRRRSEAYSDRRDGPSSRRLSSTSSRARFVAAVAVVVMTAVFAALAFLVLGIAVSMVAFLLIVIPAVAIVLLMAWFFQPRTR
jgi:ABC-type bacteriocin/lantibiotic exporter with double-glycine peptidase domain